MGDHEDTKAAIGAKDINTIQEESELDYTDMDQEMEDIIDEAIDKHVIQEQDSDEIIADVTDESGKKIMQSDEFEDQNEGLESKTCEFTSELFSGLDQYLQNIKS